MVTPLGIVFFNTKELRTSTPRRHCRNATNRPLDLLLKYWRPVWPWEVSAASLWG